MSTPSDLPIFPLNSVLFPGGLLPLRVFEPRYMAMVSECMKGNRPFGVCLIAQGSEVGAPAVPHMLGTTATITEWDMAQLGVLHVTARGGERFRIESHQADGQGVIRARVTLLEPEAAHPVPERLKALVQLLAAMVSQLDAGHVAEPRRLDDATWVGYRFAELLPIPSLARQKLLELDDAVSRLEIVYKFLAQRGLLR